MIRSFQVESFKSLERIDVELGHVNVFIGANGSGKSDLLEAIGVLSAAASGQVNDLALLQRGGRPGVPALYKSSFRNTAGRAPPHLSFGAGGDDVSYEVTLHNPLKEPLPAWRYKTELWKYSGTKIVGRGPAMAARPNPEQGLCSPTTSVLCGILPEPKPRKPIGLSGGQLPQVFERF